MIPLLKQKKNIFPLDHVAKKLDKLQPFLCSFREGCSTKEYEGCTEKHYCVQGQCCLTFSPLSCHPTTHNLENTWQKGIAFSCSF